MFISTRRFCHGAWVALALLAAGRSAPAASQTWIGGTGAWSTGTNWTPNSWVAGNTAIFNATAGSVTVGTQTAGGLTFNAGGYTLQSGTLTLTNGAVIATTGGTTTFASSLALSGAAGIALTKTGPGTLSLATANGNLGTSASPSTWTVTGGTLVGGYFDSVLSVSFGSSLGATPASAATQLVLDAGTFEVRSAGSPAVGATRRFQVNAAGGAIRDVSGGGNTYQNPIVNNAGGGSSLYLSNTGGTMTFSGAISGAGSFTYAGGTASAAASFGNANPGLTGSFIVNSGTFEFTNNTAAGTGTITVNSGGGVSTLGCQIANAVILDGGRIGWDFFSGSGDYQGPVTLQAGGGIASLVNFYGSGAMSGTISGKISGSGALSTTAAGPSATSRGGVLTLSGANDYTGGTTIGAGTTIKVANSGALGAATSALSISGTLDLNGRDVAAGALAMNGGTLNSILGAGSANKLSVSSASVSGTNSLSFDVSNLSGNGTYDVIGSAGGGLTGTFQFAGASNLTVPVDSLIVKNSGGSYYRLSLTNTSAAQQVTVTSDVPSRVLTILPFGSSITAGQSAQSPYDGGGYRTQLYQDLVNDGRFTPNDIGSGTALLTNNPTGGNILATANQLRHEGHPGWNTQQMLANLGMSNGDPGANGGNWLGSAGYGTPDYVTINIGGNDAVNYGTTDAILLEASHRLDAIITRINTLVSPANPDVATIVSSIAYRGDNGGAYGAGIDAYYNPRIQGVVFNHVLAGQNAAYLDLRNVISYPADISSDNIHPTQAGYDKMADAWYQSVAYGAAYWKGGQGTAWSGISGGSTNWAMDRALTTDRGKTLNDPSANTFLIYPDVYFSNNGTPLSTTLGADTTVRSLNFAAGAAGSVTIGAGGTLTIGAVDTSSGVAADTLDNVGGITVQAGTGAHTIAADIALGADQTWGNVSSNDLTVSGSIGGAHGLTFVGSYTIYNPGVYTPNGTNYSLATYTTTSSTVAGTGGFILAGANGYTGATALDSAAKVTVNGSLSATSSVSVSPDSKLTVNGLINAAAPIALSGTLRGAGSVGVVTAASGASIAPGGASTGVLTVSSLDLRSGAQLVMRLGGTDAGAYDRLAVNGSLTIAGDLQGSLINGFIPAPGDRFFLTFGTTSTSGSFGNVGAASGAALAIGADGQLMFGGITYGVFYHANGVAGTLTDGSDIALVAVPEAQGWAALGGMALLLCWCRFRQRNCHCRGESSAISR